MTIDSDKAAKLARDYAEANGAVVTSMNYELKKDGPDAAPAWRVSCLDDKGAKVGEVVVTAGKGNVVSHQGFALAPAPDTTPGPKKKKEPHFDTYAKQEVAPAAANSPVPPIADGPDPGGHPRRKPTPKKPESPIGKTFDSVGRTLHKILPF
jgi:hypothetical protein